MPFTSEKGMWTVFQPGVKITDVMEKFHDIMGGDVTMMALLW